MHHHSNNFISTSFVKQLALLNQKLIHRSLNFGLETKQLEDMKQDLAWLQLKSKNFDFVAQISNGMTLLLGEGNLSFALHLVEDNKTTPHRIVATTFEDAESLPENAKENATLLKQLGATVIHNVDATNLHSHFGSWLFDNIVFQFPHTGSREAVEGHNPNFILLRDFLKSAAAQLRHTGQVIVTTVDSPHYRGAFQVEEAAEDAGFKLPESYPFDPFAFDGYEHSMTHQNESALGHHDNFITWVFKR